ncbi:hypothetical protein WJX73_005660 [Symbiochloris irregularis]|uniref:Uncharacterized protein n=1 Tax=Symbiochloris irregularis TaxID=706552 RepID=A0AAW1PAE1_9CHLO
MASFWRTLGNIVRSTGQALDTIGCGIQGRLGVKETVSNHQTLAAYGGRRPILSQIAFVAPNASLIGDVTVGHSSSIWYGAVLRGDVNRIKIGENTNILDNAVIHVAKHNAADKSQPTIIGNNVTIGHGAVVHAATVEDGALVGMGAMLLDGSTVQKGSIVAAGAMLSPGKTVPSGEVWAGTPARYLRNLEEGEADFIIQSANNYAALAAVHAAENGKTFAEIEEDKERRQDRMERDPDYDSHLGVARDPVTREVIQTAEHT